MTERERLIQLLQSSHCVEFWNHNTDDFIEPNPIEKLADYLLANGVVCPPCKVGDKVYRIAKLFCDKTIIVEGEVFEFAITHESAKKDEYRFYFRAFNEDFIHRNYSKWCDFFDFSKTVFLSREEAEAALERSRG